MLRVLLLVVETVFLLSIYLVSIADVARLSIKLCKRSMIGAKATKRETTERTVNRARDASGKTGKTGNSADQVRNSSKLASVDQSTDKFVSVVIFI